MTILCEYWQIIVKKQKWTFLCSNWIWECDEYTHVIYKVPIHISLMMVSIFYKNWQTNVKKHPKWTFLGSNSIWEWDDYTHIIFIWKVPIHISSMPVSIFYENWLLNIKTPKMDITRLKLKVRMRWVQYTYAI